MTGLHTKHCLVVKHGASEAECTCQTRIRRRLPIRNLPKAGAGDRLLYELRLRVPLDVQLVQLANGNLLVTLLCPECGEVVRPKVAGDVEPPTLLATVEAHECPSTDGG